jgi:nucleoside-diphosphate-sugar epimerase
MIRVAVTGSKGFIGSNFIKANQEQFQIVAIGIRTNSDSMTATPSLLDDIAGLAKALEGCDAIVHCVHDGSNESANLVYGTNLIKAAKLAGVRRMVAFGTFATYDNSGEKITESSRACSAHIPYIVEKRRLEKALARELDTTHPSLRLAFLQPTIVVGQGGSWDRFARRLQVTERILLPERGARVCNLVHVDTVTAAIRACLEAPDASFGEGRILKTLVSGSAPVTWAEWLGNEYGIPAGRIEACNDNSWAESAKRNFLLSLRYSALGNAVLNLRPARAPYSSSRSGATHDTDSAQRHAIYMPEGLDRLTLACRAIVKSEGLRIG